MIRDDGASALTEAYARLEVISADRRWPEAGQYHPMLLARLTTARDQLAVIAARLEYGTLEPAAAITQVKVVRDSLDRLREQL